MKPALKYEIREAILAHLFREDEIATNTYFRIRQYLTNLLNFAYTETSIKMLLPEQLYPIIRKFINISEEDTGLINSKVFEFKVDPYNQETYFLILEQLTLNILRGDGKYGYR